MILNQLSKIRHIVLDMDGTIYSGSNIFHFTHGFFNTLNELGIEYTYLTNNSSRSVMQYLDKLHKMGLTGSKENIYTSSLLTIDYLSSQRKDIKKLFILGTQGLKTEFRDAGYQIMDLNSVEEPDAVIIGFDTSLVYENLCKAGYWIKLGKPFIATHPDRICPTDQRTLLVDCGALCACLESATGRGPDIVLGKPDPKMIWGILERNNLKKSEVAMVGDRLYTDIEMAHQAGVMGILVLSGEATKDDLNGQAEQPDLVLENIMELGKLLEKSRI